LHTPSLPKRQKKEEKPQRPFVTAYNGTTKVASSGWGKGKNFFENERETI